MLNLVAPDKVYIKTEPQRFSAGERGRLICQSTSSNPVAEISWWKSGSLVHSVINNSEPGLYGGFISTAELVLDLTEDMNSEAYTCQAKNVKIDKSVHQITNLNVLCK